MDAEILSGSASSCLYRLAADSDVEPEEWQEIYDRLNQRAAHKISILTKAAAAAGTFAGIFAVTGIMAAIVSQIYPTVSPYYLICFVLPPALLAGAASGQATGNLFLRGWFDLDETTRRGFAARLTLARAPAAWPVELIRWLFAGDWLETPGIDSRLPYARAFVMGPLPAACRDEAGLWREIHSAISCVGLMEVGANHWEISYPKQFPTWMEETGWCGGFEELEKRIGVDTASEWAERLRRRARRQWPDIETTET
ncbi:MAG: hypothetical protein FWG74_01165, partial [Planctomycetes bacterium]|nr:hypothetical protein [Planctomycetota bacterium]